MFLAIGELFIVTRGRDGRVDIELVENVLGLYHHLPVSDSFCRDVAAESGCRVMIVVLVSYGITLIWSHLTAWPPT
jgi:hypothetical protein